MMQHISLFSGIGGFDLASEWMGWTNVASCERNPFGRKVLDYYWPNAYHHDDIHTLTKELLIEKSNWNEQEPTILTGGFPCQPYSTAGKRLGKEDERHLWPEMLRVIRFVRPSWIVGENVHGIISWSDGLVFDEVQADLEAEGYEVWPYILPAAGVDAPHRRDRVWFVAYSNKRNDGRTPGEDERESGAQWLQERDTVRQPSQSGEVFGNAPDSEHNGHLATEGGRSDGEDCQRSKKREDSTKQSTKVCESGQLGGLRDAADTGDQGLQGCQVNGSIEGGREKRNKQLAGCVPPNWEEFPTQPPIRSRNDGISTRTHSETFYETDDMDRDYIIQNAVKEGKIEVDFTTGRIFSKRIRGQEGKKIELKGADCNGYRVHNISFNGIKKSCRAHQIIWIAANGLYDREKYVIDHKNRDKADNRLENLRLATPSQNRRNADDYTGQFSPEEKERIAVLYHNSDMSMRELAEYFNISKSRVGQIVQEQKLLDEITFSKWRNESIKAAGNAIVPQVVLQIFKTIEQFESVYLNPTNANE